MKTKELYEDAKLAHMETLDDQYTSSEVGQLKQLVRESEELRDNFYENK